MNIGFLLILLAFACLIICTISFYLEARGRKRFASLGRAGYNYFVLFVILASVLLLYYFLAGDYSYRYVYEYSSSDLSVFYLISGFWAGQRGTYLLWLLVLCLLGYYLLKRGGQYSAYAMFFYSLIGIFFCVILLVLSPFEKLPVAQPDGAGLNPLLKDPWMVIHPPVMFLGYATIALPCVIALAALIKKKYDAWLPIAFAPVALGALALSAGNIMGGFWAYKTLGWGGYWAWDPVENSSFIPWMTSLALIHGLLIERKSGSMRKTNLFLALLTFLLVVYGTFLTRSGVLADFSVHSFVDLGVNIYLIGFMIGFTLLSVVIYLARARHLKGPAVNLAVTSQEFALLVSIWLLLLIAALVFSGTSWPLLTTLLGNPGTVDTSVYTRITFPLAILLGLFLGFSPFLKRAVVPLTAVFKRALPSAVISIVVVVSSFILGVKQISHLLFIFFAALALFSNLFAMVRRLPQSIWKTASQISHLGFSLMILGILGSSAYATHEKVTIPRGAEIDIYNKSISYEGMAGEITQADNEVILTISDGEGKYEARPKLFWASRLNGLMKKPYIRRYPGYDLYLAPEQILENEDTGGIRLNKGEATDLPGPIPVKLTFIGFEQQAHEVGGTMKFGARIEVDDLAGRVDTIIPAMGFETNREISYEDSPLLKNLHDNLVRLERIFADEGAILVSIGELTPQISPDSLILEVSQKPTMNILWGGAILLVLGNVFSVRNRWRQSLRHRSGE